MEELVKVFNETGNSEVDVEKVVAAWNDKFSISQWHEEYRLIEQIDLDKEDAYKVGISKEQALEIIEKGKLLPIQSSFFRSATTWRTESNIISMREKIVKAYAEEKDHKKFTVYRDVIQEFEGALEKRL